MKQNANKHSQTTVKGPLLRSGIGPDILETHANCFGMTYERQLRRLSRQGLLSLCIKWTHCPDSVPYLTSNRRLLETQQEDYLYQPADSRKALREIYRGSLRGNDDLAPLSKNELVERIIYGDWQRGLSFEQLADIDFELLKQDGARLKWSALELTPLEHDDGRDNGDRPTKRRKLSRLQGEIKRLQYPLVRPSQFMKNLKEHTSKLVKTHARLEHVQQHNLSVVRLQIVPDTPFMPLSSDVPRSESLSTNDSSTIFIALPDSCPYIYVSVTGVITSLGKHDQPSRGHTGMAASKRILLEAIPKALSVPQHRWSLRSTNLISTSLKTMTAMRSGMRSGTTGGSMSSLNDHTVVANSSLPIESWATPVELRPRRARRLSQHFAHVETRSGPMKGVGHVALSRFQVRVRNMMHMTAIDTSTPDGMLSGEPQPSAPASITLTGPDVLRGLKQLALDYPTSVDINRLPGAMTGEAGRSFVNI